MPVSRGLLATVHVVAEVPAVQERGTGDTPSPLTLGARELRAGSSRRSSRFGTLAALTGRLQEPGGGRGKKRFTEVYM